MIKVGQRPVFLIGLVLGLLALILFAISLGSVAVPLDHVLSSIAHGLGWFPAGADDGKWDAIIFLVRLPRVLAAALIGASLALSGAVMQGVLRNPMADPGIIGISGGAGLGAVIAIASGLSAHSLYFLPISASLGALAAAGIIFALTLGAGKMAVHTLILAGMAVSTFFGACTSLVLSFVSHDNVAQFVFWAMGNLYNIRWESLGLVSLPVLIGLVLMPAFAKDINVMLLGEEESRAVGLDIVRIRFVLLALVAVTTALAVCISGPIAFVGLIVPHILRLLVGPDHRVLLPTSALGGAIFLVVCDLLARTALGAQEIQVGIVTSLLGAPYFIALLLVSLRREAP